MPETKPSKICVHCGEDCSAQPRIKDSHDNYYHKICHEAAEQHGLPKETVAKSTPPAPEPPDAASFANDEPIPLADEPSAELDDSSELQSPDKPFSDLPSLMDDSEDDGMILDDSDGVGLEMDDSFGD
ncbi:MAG: hypothetical protein O7G85_08765 [Planctomycetota bacterium]|nr:hypothetical protein [Planctomycetota bacterium]